LYWWVVKAVEVFEAFEVLEAFEIFVIQWIDRRGFDEKICNHREESVRGTEANSQAETVVRSIGGVRFVLEVCDTEEDTGKESENAEER
jgi:hypothetical protein